MATNKQLLNEIARFQAIAGLRPINSLNEDDFDNGEYNPDEAGDSYEDGVEEFLHNTVDYLQRHDQDGTLKPEMLANGGMLGHIEMFGDSAEDTFGNPEHEKAFQDLWYNKIIPAAEAKAKEIDPQAPKPLDKNEPPKKLMDTLEDYVKFFSTYNFLGKTGTNSKPGMGMKEDEGMGMEDEGMKYGM